MLIRSAVLEIFYLEYICSGQKYRWPGASGCIRQRQDFYDTQFLDFDRK